MQEPELHPQVEEGRAEVELRPLELEDEDFDQELPEVVDGRGVHGQEGGDEVFDVVARGEAEDLGDDRGDSACRQAVAKHSTRLTKSNRHGSK